MRACEVYMWEQREAARIMREILGPGDVNAPMPDPYMTTCPACGTPCEYDHTYCYACRTQAKTNKTPELKRN